MRPLLLLLATLLATLTTSAQVPSYVPSDGLVAWYPFNGDANDASGNNHHGTTDGAQFHEDRTGLASSSALFDGVDDGIFIPHHADFESAEKSISFWMNPAIEQFLDTPGLSDGMGVINKTDHTASNTINRYYAVTLGQGTTGMAPFSLTLATSTGNIVTIGSSVESTTAQDAININEWQHVSAVQTATELKLYLNGIQISASPLLNPPLENDYDIKIGIDYKFTVQRYFNGSIDDIAFHNRALTDAEIQAMSGFGCTDDTACNYNPIATQDDGSCDLCGCLQPPTVVAGFGTNYLLASDGILTGWGANNMDQTTIPADLPHISKADAAEEYVIWLDEDQNVTIQGGNGPYSNSVPAGLQGIDVAAGRHHMVVVKTDGSLLSLGANYTGLQNEPVVNNAVQGAAGWYHNAAVLDDGSVVGWGDNWSAPANPITNAVAIDAGVDHTLVLKDDFTVEEWGNNINSAAAWGGLTNVVDIAAGGHGSLAIMSDGSMLAWSATDGSILFESDPGDIVLDADIDWGSLIVMYADGSLETALTPPADALAFSDNWEGCGLCASDADGDGICNAEDDACYLNAGLPVFAGVVMSSPASGADTSDGVFALDVSGGSPTQVVLEGLNGTPSLSFPYSPELTGIPPGLYAVTVLDQLGCEAVANAPGGDTSLEPPVSHTVSMNYTFCCGDCGIHDVDQDGLCDDQDQCTDRAASNYDALDNAPCAYPCAGQHVVTYHGHDYDIVEIGDQCWFAENLRAWNYRNGDAIPEETDGPTWASLTTGAAAAFDNDNSNYETFGLLYNWYAVSDSRGICPSGWHGATESDFQALLSAAGGSTEADVTLRSDEVAWIGSNPDSGTDALGFGLLPGGMRDGYYGHGNFQYFQFYGALWASDFGYKFFLVNGDGEAGIYSNAVSDAGKYVRCVKD